MFFITFEGIDGSGKTTQAKLLEEYLEAKGHKVWLTSEPTDSTIGQEVRDWISRMPIQDLISWDLELQKLFALDRQLHLYELKKKLSEGYLVISDRYILSSLVYCHWENFPKVQQLNKGFLREDISIILSVDAHNALFRLITRPSSLDKLEKSIDLKLINDRYTRSTYPNSKIIDGNRPIYEIACDVAQLVEKELESFSFRSGVVNR